MIEDSYSSVHEVEDRVRVHLYGQLRPVSGAASTFAHQASTGESLKNILKMKSSKIKVA